MIGINVDAFNIRTERDVGGSVRVRWTINLSNVG